MYYRMFIIISLVVCSLSGYHSQEELAQFGDLCMEVWTQADLVKGINISETGKSEILEKIIKTLAYAYIMFDQIYETKDGDMSKSCALENVPTDNLKQTLESIRESINETFGHSNCLSYTTTINLLDIMLNKLTTIEQCTYTS